jgi:lysozyme
MSPEGKERVMEQLKIDEGVVHEVYLDHLGLPTVGIGHLILPSDAEHDQEVGTPITEERCEELFMKDLDVALSECETLYSDDWEGFPEEVQEILVNMLFNMGRPRLSQFKKMNAALVDGDWSTAAVEGRDSRWHKQVGNRAERLMTRLETV